MTYVFIKYGTEYGQQLQKLIYITIKLISYIGNRHVWIVDILIKLRSRRLQSNFNQFKI